MAPRKPHQKSQSSMAKKPGSAVTASKSATNRTKPSSKSSKSTKEKNNDRVKKPLHVQLRESSTKKAKKRKYTDKELGIPQLNSIVPIGVSKPTGKKKGKVFVDDQNTMMNIINLVSNEQDGQFKSKLEKSRQLEIIREQKRQEIEEKENHKKAKLDDAKDNVRRKRKRPTNNSAPAKSVLDEASRKEPRKRVSFV